MKKKISLIRNDKKKLLKLKCNMCNRVMISTLVLSIKQLWIIKTNFWIMSSKFLLEIIVVVVFICSLPMALHASFSGKRVLITGGANGLGRHLVERLYNDNAMVYALDKDENALETMRLIYPNLQTISVDLANWEETKRAVESIGFVDYLVNNAGINHQKPFLDITPQDFQIMFDVNLRSIIAVSQVVAKRMIENEKGGSIVNISSTSAKTTQPDFCLYSSTKSGVNMLTKSMAVELSPYNIRVNCICPSFMETGLVEDRMMRLRSQPNGFLQSRALIKRFIQPEEAADLVLFLLSPLASMITGSEYLIDGGVSTN